MKIFRGSRKNLSPDLNLSAKKKTNSAYLLSEQQCFIAFTFHIDLIKII